MAISALLVTALLSAAIVIPESTPLRTGVTAGSEPPESFAPAGGGEWIRSTRIPLPDSIGWLQGAVLEAEGGSPIRGATVTVNGVSTITDARGAFSFERVAAGVQVVTVSLSGYHVQSDTVRVNANTTTQVVMRLARNPIRLEPVTAAVRSGWLEANGFYERRMTGGSGRFIDRNDIERRNIHATTELLRNLSGVRHHSAFNASIIRFNRPVRMGRTGVLQTPVLPSDDFERWLVSLPGCQPVLYVDGRPFWDRNIRNVGPAVSDYDFIDPSNIDGIEVYVGANTPTRFANANGCGAILIWLRRS